MSCVSLPEELCPGDKCASNSDCQSFCCSQSDNVCLDPSAPAAQCINANKIHGWAEAFIIIFVIAFVVVLIAIAVVAYRKHKAQTDEVNAIIMPLAM